MGLVSFYTQAHGHAHQQNGGFQCESHIGQIKKVLKPSLFELVLFLGSLCCTSVIIIIIIQFFIYLCAELNSQWPVTESARIQTTTAISKHKTKWTRNNKGYIIYK
jgi:hypothetical protein